MNTTGMLAELAVAIDRDARDHCVVAVKGTFYTDERGVLGLASEQMPLIRADEHYGAPASTCVRYECDFSLVKARTDVVVVGKAVAPAGVPVTSLRVRLDVQGRRKEVTVHGERAWVSTLGGLAPGVAAPFNEIPLTFERAWGGQDDSQGPGSVKVERRNLVGVGYHPQRRAAEIEGLPVPNLESPRHAITSPRGDHEPVGFGCIGRAWQPRVALAGTYDQRWRDERAPHLPADFDVDYFQCAPRDQQFPHFRGGETIRCANMAVRGEVTYVIPTVRVPVRFRFRDADAERMAVLDTVICEPHLGRAMLVWRASVPLRKKLTALREILVGEPPASSRVLGQRRGKPVLAGIAATIAWLRHRRGGGG